MLKKVNVYKLFVGGLTFLSASAALADNTDSRITTYKNNGLLPANYVAPTMSTVDSGDVVQFSSTSLSWVSEDVTLARLYNTYGELNLSDWQATAPFRATPLPLPVGNIPVVISAWSSYASAGLQDKLDYLAAVSRGDIISEDLSAAEATQLRQNFIASWSANGGGVVQGAEFTVDGSGLDVSPGVMDISRYRNLTPTQFLTALQNCNDFSEVRAKDMISGSFTGSEDFSGVALCYTDLSGVSGITANQIIASPYYAAVSSHPGVNLSAAQYAAFKDTIAASLGVGNSATIRVDGVSTVIAGTAE